MIQDIYVRTYYRLVGKSYVMKLLRFLVRYLANFHLKCAFFFNRHLYCCTGNKEDVIVSLTSFPSRINNLWVGIESLLRQSAPPQKIYIWLSRKQFHDSATIPFSLRRLEKRGVDIRLVDGDIRSHKKYYYVFREHPNDLIMLVDDDIIYPSDLIQSLLNARGMIASDKIITHKYGYIMRYTVNGELEPYKKWGSFYSAYDGGNLFFGSGGGTLLRPSDLYHDVLDLSLALQLCPLADDVWLNAMAKLALCSYAKVEDGPVLPIYNKSAHNLSDVNVKGNENDVQIANVQNYYSNLIGVTPF